MDFLPNSKGTTDFCLVKFSVHIYVYLKQVFGFGSYISLSGSPVTNSSERNLFLCYLCLIANIYVRIMLNQSYSPISQLLSDAHGNERVSEVSIVASVPVSFVSSLGIV
jgi:hypothetical protein